MKKFNKWAAMALSISMAITVISCEKDDEVTTTPPKDALSEYTLLGSQKINNDTWNVSLYMSEDPFVGYNYVAVRVSDAATNTMIEGATVSFMPMMDMGTMMHSCPYESPAYDNTMDAYMGTSTFIMPSGGGTWMFNVMVSNQGEMDTASFSITVMAKAESKLYNFISNVDSSTVYFVALKEPMNPEIGLNNFELMIYKRASMMSFPAVSDLKVEIYPEMPSMGHGSPNNVHPVSMGDGLYQGKVNFTMSGYWKVNVTIMDNTDATLDDMGAFDITLK